MRLLPFIVLSLILTPLRAQFGGSSTFAYLNLPPSARIAGLSGLNISTWGNDVNFSWQNPALLNEEMNGQLSVSNAFLPAGINSGSVAYAKYVDDKNITVGGGLLYRAYGNFQLTELNGDQIGNFTGGEYALYAGTSYGLNKLHYGLNAKVLFSQLESYHAFGVAADFAAAYIDTSRRLNFALVFRNAGYVLQDYTKDNKEPLPFQIDFAISKRLAHLPLQLSFTLHDLQTFDIRYDDPAVSDNSAIFGADTTADEKKYTIDKIARHLNVAGEFYFGKNVLVQIGYDHMKRKELSLSTLRGLTGFSFGFGVQIKRFNFAYAHEFYSIAGGNNMITIGTNTNSLFGKQH